MPKPATIIDPKVKPNPALEKRTRRVFTTDPIRQDSCHSLILTR
ncbi:hypothetical protein OURE66S_00895 [Oligella ureolytica]|jgi:hypothetical protein